MSNLDELKNLFPQEPVKLYHPIPVEPDKPLTEEEKQQIQRARDKEIRGREQAKQGTDENSLIPF